MASQQEKAFCVLHFEVSRSVITVQREFHALQSQIWTPQNGAHRKTFPAATPSWKLARWPHSKDEKQTAGNARETWTVAAADGVCCAPCNNKFKLLLI